MERKRALIVAGFLAATITSGVILFGSYAARAAADRPATTSSQIVDVAANSTAADQAYLTEVQATLAEREAVLAAQLEQNKNALAELDAQAQSRLADMQTQLDVAATGAQDKAASLETLQAQAAELQLAREELEALAEEENLTVLGWRDVPVDASVLGASARAVMPHITQFFVAARSGAASAAASRELDAAAWRIRRRAHNKLGVYFASFSSQSIVYKGMVSTAQLEPFYPDLSDAGFASRCAIVHSRFSTNTFPSWPLAQPFRTIAHNGEINTVKGNRNWMRARQSTLASDLLGEVPEELFPICTAGASDSASFDEVAEMDA